MKLQYDDSKKKLLETNLDEITSKLNAAINYAEGISIPSSFGRSGDINLCISNLRNAKTKIGQTQAWLVKVNNGFQTKQESAKNRVNKIENIKITKKDLLVK